jgi:hypothetical protein
MKLLLYDLNLFFNQPQVYQGIKREDMNHEKKVTR